MNGSRLEERRMAMGGAVSLHSSSGLTIPGDLHVDGSLVVEGANLNLGAPLTAAEPLTRGDIVSLSPSGGVAKGFGMQISSSLTSLDIATRPQVVRMSDTVIAVAYLDSMRYLQVVSYDSALSAADSPVAVNGTHPVETFTITSPGPTSIVVCYKVEGDPQGHCVSARHTGVFTFGDVLDLPDTSTYFSGVLTNLRDVDDRVVLVYSMAADLTNVGTESTRAQVLSVSGLSVSTLSLPRSLMSTKVDHLAATSIHKDRILVSYRVVRDEDTEVRELYFRSDDSVNILATSRFSLATSGANLGYMSLDRLTDDSGILVFRDIHNDHQLRSVVVDASGFPLLDFGPETVVDSGTLSGTDEGLAVSVTAVSSTRVGYVYVDAAGVAQYVDAGLFGQSVVVGRPQAIRRGAGMSSAVTAAAMDPAASSAVVIQQSPTEGSVSRGASVQRATLFGGPTMLGLARNDAAAAGSEVTVVLSGALDAYSDLRPGAPYYARFDGGIADTPDAVSGVSDQIVGKGVTPDIMLSLIGSDGETNRANIASVRRDISSLQTLSESVSGFMSTVEEAFRDSDIRRSDLPIIYWSQWSSYSQRHGWYTDNRQELWGGIHPSNWGDGGHRVYQAMADKKAWLSLFNRRMYPGPYGVVCAQEWYHYSSTNSMNCGVMMRVKNTKTEATNWNLRFYYSSYGGWGEHASLSFDGTDRWGSSSNCAYCSVSLDLAIPAGRTSTVLIAVGSCHPSSTRANFLAFYDSALTLPDGLEWVDDVHYDQTGGWDW